MKAMLKLIVIATLFFQFTSALAEATSVEMDAAVARISSALYKVEFLLACGFGEDENQKQAIKRVAPVLALQKDGLSKKITNDQYVEVLVRATNKDLTASMQQRAQIEATPTACKMTENKELWDALVFFANLAQKPN